MSLIVCASLTYRSQELVQYGEKEFLDLDIAEAASPVVSFEFVKILILRQIFLERIRLDESIQLCEYCVAFDLARILYSQMSRVCEHGHDFLAECLLIVRQIDSVAERLGHLGLTVCSRKSQAGFVRRQIDLRLYQYIAFVQPVEASYDLSALFEHRLLILSDRYDRCLEGSDIAGLTDRISEESYRNTLSLKTSELEFGFDRRVPLYSGYCDEIHVVNCQFMQLRHLRLDEYVRFLRIKSH
jgi:hypothetical protein